MAGPSETSLLQALQAQQLTDKGRVREKSRAEVARRFQDSVELRVAESDGSDAVKPAAEEPNSNGRKERPKRGRRDPEQSEGDNAPRSSLDVTG